MVLPSHIPPLCVGEGFYIFWGFVRKNCCVGVFFVGRDAGSASLFADLIAPAPIECERQP